MGIPTQPGGTMRAKTRVSGEIDNRATAVTVVTAALEVGGNSNPALVIATLEAGEMPAIEVGQVVETAGGIVAAVVAETASAIGASLAEVDLVALAPLAGLGDPAEAAHEPAVAAARPAWEARVAVVAPGVVAVGAVVVVAGGDSWKLE